MTLAKPNYSDQAKFHVALDCIIFGFNEGELKLLIHKRKFEPLLGDWSLFGGFLKTGESLDAGARRILFELTGIDDIYLEQLFTYGEVDRDSAGRVISASYFALIPEHRYSSDFSKKYGATWVPLNEIPELIMDHNDMVAKGLKRLRRRALTQPIGFELLPSKFTIPQLQMLYEAIYQKSLDNRNFRKKLLAMNVLVKLETKDKSTSKKGAFLYRFNKKKYNKLHQDGFLFDL